MTRKTIPDGLRTNGMQRECALASSNGRKGEANRREWGCKSRAIRMWNSRGDGDGMGMEMTAAMASCEPCWRPHPEGPNIWQKTFKTLHYCHSRQFAVVLSFWTTFPHSGSMKTYIEAWRFFSLIWWGLLLVWRCWVVARIIHLLLHLFMLIIHYPTSLKNKH